MDSTPAKSDWLAETGLFLRRHFRRWKPWLLQSLLFTGYVTFLEIFFHITEGMPITARFVYPVLFSLPLGFLFSALFSIFRPKINCILSTVVAGFFGVWTLTQIIYHSVFLTYMEFNKISMGGDVAGDFGAEMWQAIVDNIPKIIAVVLMTAVFSLVLILYLRPCRQSIIVGGASLIVFFLLQGLAIGYLHISSDDSPFSPANVYNQYPRVLDTNMESFGVMTSLRLDLFDTIFGSPSGSTPDFETVDFDDLLKPKPSTTAPTTNPPQTDIGDNPLPPDTDPSVTGGDVVDPPTTTPVEPPKLQNILDIDLDTIIANEKDDDLLAIHQYVNSLPASNTHQYTGMFKGYNLIMICAESFSDRMISPELTPTLYKMANNGFVFENYYGSFKSITTNGEYAFCTGLLPNTVGKTDDLKQNSTFLLSADKYLPYCMGNVFTSVGASSYAYHSNNDSYYQRGLTHPNMGYELVRFLNGAYKNGIFDKSWKLSYSMGTKKPNSDFETAQQTLDDYLSNVDENGNVKPFTAYYMTYSGHHPYYDIYNDTDHSMSPATFLNREKVDGLNCSGVLKSYYACNLEIENMLTEIERRLKEAGCWENTVIVLTNDHYPYGLTDKVFREMAGKYVDPNFGIYENAFICYNAGMETPVVVDTPCCTVDIIPTLLNLFGYDYDSRLLAGTDVLDPNSFHVAMLYNKSFVTDQIKFNASTNKVTYLVDKDTVSDAYVKACTSYVLNKFEMSLQVIQNDYFRVFYDYFEAQKAN